MFKRDRHEDCIMFNNRLFGQLISYCGNYDNDFLEIHNYRYLHLIILRLDDFLTWVDRKTIDIL